MPNVWIIYIILYNKNSCWILCCRGMSTIWKGEAIMHCYSHVAILLVPLVNIRDLIAWNKLEGRYTFNTHTLNKFPFWQDRASYRNPDLLFWNDTVALIQTSFIFKERTARFLDTQIYCYVLIDDRWLVYKATSNILGSLMAASVCWIQQIHKTSAEKLLILVN